MTATPAPVPSMESGAMAIGPATPEPATPEPIAAEPMAAALPAQNTPADWEAAGADESQQPRSFLIPTLGVLLILTLVWTGVRLFGGHRAPAPPPPAVQAPAAPAAEAGAPPASVSTTQASLSRAPPAAIHEVMPDVPPRALRTIRGHIKVWVRVIINQDGSVFAATPDRTGSSRYFERHALEAAKKWTFPPVDTPSQRLMQIRFDFSREGTTGRAVTLH
jgi:outer membrane biosynthesis protein TonB